MLGVETNYSVITCSLTGAQLEQKKCEDSRMPDCYPAWQYNSIRTKLVQKECVTLDALINLCRVGKEGLPLHEPEPAPGPGPSNSGQTCDDMSHVSDWSLSQEVSKLVFGRLP